MWGPKFFLQKNNFGIYIKAFITNYKLIFIELKISLTFEMFYFFVKLKSFQYGRIDANFLT